MANELDAIMAALSGGGGGGFFDSPQTALEASQVADVARQRQQQRSQLDFLTGLLEAQTTQQIRGKQATDPEARIVQLLKEGQFAPDTGMVQRAGGEREIRTFAPSTDVIGQLTALLGMQAAKTKTAAPADRLNAILGEMTNREKVVRDLTTQFLAAQTGKDKAAMAEIQKKLIAERAALLRDIETMGALGPEWGAIAQGFGSRMATSFNIAGVPFSLRPEPGQAPAAAAGAPAAAPQEKPKARRPEEQALSEGLSRLLADLLGLGGPGFETVTP